MDGLRNEDVMWYVATRKDSGAHHLLNEYYIEEYEDEFVRIREFDTLEEAKEALDKREEADAEKVVRKRKKIAVSKVRGDIRKGSVEDEEIHAKMQKEIMEAEETVTKVPSSKKTTRPTKNKLD